MFSLVITLVAIALVALLALAALYYGTTAFTNAGARSRAATALNQSAQVLGAAELHFVEKKGWSSSMDELVGAGYLKDAPILAGLAGDAVPWAQPMPNVPTYWALKSLDSGACREVNRLARGDNGIYKKARPGLVTQCFGLAEPFTVVTTRQGLADAGLGLDVVFEFFDQKNPGQGEGFDPSGGGWALEPTVTPNPGEGGNPSSGGDKGTPGGDYLDGDVKVTLPGQGDIGANVVKVGSVSSNGTVTQEIRVVNTGDTPLNLGGTLVSGDIKLVGSTCTGTLQPGQACVITVQGGPFPGTTEPRDIAGTVVLETDRGSIEVGVTGTVYPAAPGPVQVGISTNDPADTGSLLVFPDTEVGQTSYKWVRVQNVGEALTYGGAPLSALPPFAVAETDCGGNLPYGAFCWARLAFSPTAAMVYSGANHVLTLVANGQSITLGLTGKGTPKPVAGVSVLPDNLDWGSQFALGPFSLPAYNLTVTVRNNGETPLTFAQAPSVEEGADSWMVNGTTCGAKIPRDGSCSVTVRFIPDKAQAFEGQLRLAFSEEGVGTKRVALKAVATNPLRAKTTNLSIPAAKALQTYSLSPDLGDGWELASGASLLKSDLALEVDSAKPLPDGLSLNAQTRKVEGTPATATTGAVDFKVLAVYQNKFSGERVFSIQVAEGAALLRSISAGALHTCGVTTKGSVYCWGANTNGQLGDNSKTGRTSPVLVQGLTGVAKVSAGANHTCAVTETGAAYCWGQGNAGQIGDNAVADRMVPVAVSGLTSGVVDIAAGLNYSCAVLSTGGARCWGSNSSGQLGRGNTTDSRVPAAVLNLTGAHRIVTGISNTVSCAWSDGGAARCWGYNGNGMLGDGSNQNANAPSAVKNLTGIVEMSVGGNHVCARTSAGGAWCWGQGTLGELGTGAAPSMVMQPGQVSGLTSGVTSISAGGNHGCAVVGTALRCWGATSSNVGQLGNGTTTGSRSPVVVSGVGGPVASVAAGGNFTCIVLASGASQCVGTNGFGQLGHGSTASGSLPFVSPKL